MKTMSLTRLSGFGLAALLVAAGVTVSAPSQAQDKMMLMKDRVALMKGMGQNLGPIGKTANGEMAADYAALATNAGVIRDNAMKLKGMFPEGSGGGESRALPAVWEKNADFVAYLDKLAGAADAFAKEAASGKMDNIKASFGAIAGNCAGCHKAYRAEKSS